MSMIVRLHGPPRRAGDPQVPSSSSSEDALDRLPSLSLSRCSANGLRVPSSSTWDDEAGEAARRLREHEEAVAHRRRAEPLGR